MKVFACEINAILSAQPRILVNVDRTIRFGNRQHVYWTNLENHAKLDNCSFSTVNNAYIFECHGREALVDRQVFLTFIANAQDKYPKRVKVQRPYPVLRSSMVRMPWS